MGLLPGSKCHPLPPLPLPSPFQRSRFFREKGIGASATQGGGGREIFETEVIIITIGRLHQWHGKQRLQVLAEYINKLQVFIPYRKSWGHATRSLCPRLRRNATKQGPTQQRRSRWGARSGPRRTRRVPRQGPRSGATGRRWRNTTSELSLLSSR